ncbi:MAG: TlpA disulfide reductase family protein [Bacteroidota bacterium]
MKFIFTIALIALKLSCIAQKQPTPSAFYRDTAIYSGVIKGYSSKSSTIKGKLYINDILKGLQRTSQFEIKKDGTFSVKILLNHPQDIIISIPGFMGSVYMEPGRKLFQSVETKKNSFGSTETVSTFAGALAKINTELVKARDQYQRFVYTQDEVKANPLFFEELLVSQMNKLKKYSDSVALSNKAFVFLAVNIKIAILLRYAGYVNEPASAVTTERLDLFKECLKKSSLNDPSNLLSVNYRYLIGRLRYSKIGLPSTSSEQWIKIVKSFPEATKFTAKERLEFEKVENMEHYQSFRDSHPQYVGRLSSFSTEREALNRIGALKTRLGVPEGLMYDIMRIQTFSSLLADFFIPFSDQKLTEANKLLSTPFLMNDLQLQNNEIKSKIRANKLRAKNANVLAINTWEGVLEKFKGKVIYVDFWATWCVPCREDIVEITPVKEELKDDNIAFVYITNQTSPIESYENSVPAIKGNHVRLSTSEWNRISVMFDILGLPHYLLIGKEGQVIENKVSFDGVDELRKKLLNSLKL